MRVLVVHNRYSSRVPSGENLAVDDEVRWLIEAGVEVQRHEVSNDNVLDQGARARLRQAGTVIWSPPARQRFDAVLDQVRPDLVHIHNTVPLLSASVPWTAVRRELPALWTVHNYRLRCINGTHYRRGQPCRQCRPGWRLPGIVHGCYGQSVPASALVTGATSVFRNVARRHLQVLAISGHVRRWLVDTAGVPAAQVQVKYNGVAAPRGQAIAAPSTSRVLLFPAKLEAYKGVELLLEAWQRADLPRDIRLTIVGDGPLAAAVGTAAAADPRISWLGQVAAPEVGPLVATARAVVVPSTWDEPFGRTAAEAMACGRPVITTGTGGLSEIVDPGSGWLTGTDADRLADALGDAARSDQAVDERGRMARRRHRERFSPEATTAALIEIYRRALGRRSNQRR